MVYEIGNPSDAYTMESDDEVAAATACMFLGQGAYNLQDESGHVACPFFLFGADPDEWMKQKHGLALDEAMKCKGEAIADALESVLIGGFQARREYNDAIDLMTPENAAKFREKRHDERRTSMNNIGKRAAALAESFRDKAEAMETADAGK